MSNGVEPYRIDVSQQTLRDLQARLELARFPKELNLPEGQEWSYGSPEKRIRDITDYWRTSFDWRKAEARLNELPQFTAEVDSGIQEHGFMKVHFVHQISSRKDAIPLLFIHGWPGNFFEVSKIINGLTDPKDSTLPAFHVVAPSLPGFGFSEPSKRPGFGVVAMARLLDSLMKKLSYSKYVAQGGDWGAFIVRALAVGHKDSCRAIHSNMLITAPPSITRHQFKFFKLIAAIMFSRIGLEVGYSKEELLNLDLAQKWRKDGTGYSQIQSTRPQTLAYGLTDSPVGLLGWIYEKLHMWTDNYPWTNDEILTWVMLHWLGNGPVGGLRAYKEAFNESAKGTATASEAARVWSAWSDTPFGLSIFPKEVTVLPYDWGSMVGPVKFFKKHESGGHFAAWERPDELLADVRVFVALVSKEDASLQMQKSKL